VVHPAGKLLYENVSTPGVVLGFAIAGDGTLNPLPGSPFRTTGEVTAVALNPTGTLPLPLSSIWIALPHPDVRVSPDLTLDSA